jgi:valyl-tRNA synthetase
MDYKETLHMPKTAFEMRGNLTKKEPGFQKRWQDEKLYEKMLERREGAESFVLHDGPPYANGDIHLGHALNKVLKDVIVKSHFMEGYKTPYIPGWDTHGLPIETAVTKLGYDRKKMGIAEFRKICYDYALKQVANQKAGFLSLGSIGDYQRYFTYKHKKYSHIIDPQTGYPANYVRSVTVITNDSGKADALSTTLFCMSVEDGKKYLSTLDYDVQAIWIVDKDSDVSSDLETKDYKIITTDKIKNRVTLAD